VKTSRNAPCACRTCRRTTIDITRGMRDYPHEAEVRRGWRTGPLVAWPGLAGMSQWRDAVQTRAIGSASVPIMGGEAGDTQRALDRMDAGALSARAVPPAPRLDGLQRRSD
jgi:hypothetical protein